jgi:hypothetical protein
MQLAPMHTRSLQPTKQHIGGLVGCHLEAMISKNVGQAVSLSGLEQANSLSYDTLPPK